MRTASIFLVFLSIYWSSCGQSQLRKAIQKNTHKINTLSVNDDAELQAVGRAIGNARVVMLGEQDHGDATTFEAKTRLIKYLHQKHGFDVLAFESDFFALDGAWKQVEKADDIYKLADDNLFKIWSGCQQFTGLKDYLVAAFKSAKPMQVAGFDNQLHGRYSQLHFSKWFMNFLKEKNLLAFTTIDTNTHFIQLLDSILYHSKGQSAVKDTIALKQFYSRLVQIKNALQQQGMAATYEMQVLKSLQSQVFLMITRSGNIQIGGQARDRQMADNLHWLMTHQFTNRKVIVWAANTHIYGAPIKPVRNYIFEPYYPMGHFFRQMDTTLPVYVLGFTSYTGSSQRIGGNLYEIKSEVRNSLEAWVNKQNVDYAFVDLDRAKKTLSTNESFYMAGLGHVQWMQPWMDGYNGMFYIRKMEPCTVVK